MKTLEAPATDMNNTGNLGYYHAYKYHSLQRLNYLKGEQKNMHGVKKVILFCIMIVIIPASLIILPLYLKHKIYQDVTYSVAESDIMEIRDGISSIFCQRHSLKMNSSFNAFQLNGEPQMSNKRKHIRLKKSMTLPDDTLEYWGFYLLKGATVALKVCSRYEGSRILVVKGERNLKTCGLLEHNKNRFDAQFAQERGNVVVTFETAAEIVNSANKDGSTTNNRNETYDDNQGGEDLSFVPDDDGIDMERLKKSNENYIKKIKYSSERKKNRQTDEQKSQTTKNRSSSSETEKTETKPQVNQNSSYVNSSNSTISKETKENRDTNNSRAAEFMNATTETSHHHTRHQKHRNNKKLTVANESTNRKSLTSPDGDVVATEEARRKRRDLILDGGVLHGGNNLNVTDQSSSSVSSFETGLLTCYDGQILLAQGFQPSTECKNINYLDKGSFMQTVHEVGEDGYYYYIFYSDNDLVSNDIHALFNIHKPSFEYANISESKGCVNNTACSFDINFWSDEVVIIEIPTRDGIEHEEDDITFLISTCHPRMSVYMIFPVMVLFMILGCAFI